MEMEGETFEVQVEMEMEEHAAEEVEMEQEEEQQQHAVQAAEEIEEEEAEETPEISLVKHEVVKTRLVQRKPAMTSSPTAPTEVSSGSSLLLTLTGQKLPICEQCNIAFTSERGLQSHIVEEHRQERKRHSDRQSYKHCPTCEEEFSTPAEFTQHMKVFVDHRRFKCDQCDWRCTTRKDLKRHQRKHVDGKPYACPRCNQRYKEEKNLKEHEFNEHGLHREGQELTCEFCQKELFSRASLNKHQKLHHWKDLVRLGRPVTLLNCEVCQKTFVQKQKLLEHMVVHTRSRPHKCPHCGKAFSVASSVPRHIKERHSGVPRQSSKKRQAILHQGNLDEVGNVLKTHLSSIAGRKQAVTLKFPDAQTAEAFQLSGIFDDFAVEHEGDEDPNATVATPVLSVKEEGMSGGNENANKAQASVKTKQVKLAQLPQHATMVQQQQALLPQQSLLVQQPLQSLLQQQQQQQQSLLPQQSQQSLLPQQQQQALLLPQQQQLMLPSQQQQQQQSVATTVQAAAPPAAPKKKVRYLCGVCSIAFNDRETATEHVLSHSQEQPTSATGEQEQEPQDENELQPSAEQPQATDSASGIPEPTEATIASTSFVASKPNSDVAAATKVQQQQQQQQQSLMARSLDQILQEALPGVSLLDSSVALNFADGSAVQLAFTAEDIPAKTEGEEGTNVEGAEDETAAGVMRTEDAASEQQPLVAEADEEEEAAMPESPPAPPSDTESNDAPPQMEIDNTNDVIAADATVVQEPPPIEACYQCGLCFETFPRMEDAQIHLLTHNAQVTIPPTTPPQQQQLETMATEQSQQETLSAEFVDKLHLCTDCGVTFFSAESLQRHATLEHREVVVGGATPDGELCSVCNKSYKDATALKRHLLTHSTDKPYACTLCDKTFSRKLNLQNHMGSHNDEKPFKCDICGMGYVIKYDFQRHRALHDNPKPFPCDMCDKRYTQKQDMEFHKRVKHFGEKPQFECDLCGKKFYRRDHRDTHIKHQHEGVPEYECELCGKAYFYRYRLQRHMRTAHSNEKPYKCEHCDKTFKDPARCSAHQDIHNEGTPYECDLCGKMSKTRDALRSHVLRIHGKNKTST